MASYLDILIRVRDNLLTVLDTEVAYQSIHGPKPTYHLGTRQMSWNEWLAGMQDAIAKQNALIRAEDTTQDFVRGYSA